MGQQYLWSIEEFFIISIILLNHSNLILQTESQKDLQRMHLILDHVIYSTMMVPIRFSPLYCYKTVIQKGEILELVLTQI